MIFSDVYSLRGANNLPGKSDSSGYFRDATDTFLYEASHLVADTEDFYYRRELNDRYINANKLLRTFYKKVHKGEIVYRPYAKQFLRRAYKYIGRRGRLTNDVAMDMLRNDLVLQINMMLHNADTFSFYIRDMALKRPFDTLTGYYNPNQHRTRSAEQTTPDNALISFFLTSAARVAGLAG